MTPDQITAILSLLFAFGVPQITIDQIRVEITPVAATSTISYVPVIQTPIRENQPVYFGSTPVTVVNPPVAPVVQAEPIIEPKPVVPFKVDFMGAVNSVLVIHSNKLIDPSKTVLVRTDDARNFPEWNIPATIGKTIRNGDYLPWEDNQRYVYVYEIQLLGGQGLFKATITSVDDDTFAKDISIQ